MKISKLSILTYICYYYTVNGFYLRKEADDSFILLNDNNYHDNNIELNLRYLLNDNIKDVKNETNDISPNIIKTNNIHTINKLKRRKLNKEMNPKMNKKMNQKIIQKINIISPTKIPSYVPINEQKYNLTAHNSINIKCILVQHINRKTCTFPSIFDRTDTTPSNKINQIYHDNYYIDLNDKELDFIKKFCRNYTNIDVNYKSIDYYSQTNKIYNDLDNNYTLLDNLLIGTTLYILYFAVTGNFNGICIFMTLSMFLITLNGVQNSLRNR